MADGGDKRTLSMRELMTPIHVPRLITALKLLEAQLLSNAKASGEAFGLRTFIELLLNEGNPQARAYHEVE